MIGEINWFNKEKGWGFIRANGYAKGVFLHRKQLRFPIEEAVPNLAVHFDVETTVKGAQARNVRKA